MLKGMAIRSGLVVLLAAGLGAGCGGDAPDEMTDTPTTTPLAAASERQYLLERVGDAAIVQLYADGFETLPVEDKILIWHLYEAALSGRDIYYDQKYANGLEMREVLEQILRHPDEVDEASLSEIHRYTKLFWINSGPFNNLTARKFVLDLTPDALRAAIEAAGRAGASLPRRRDETLDQLIERLTPLFLDPDVDRIVTNKSPGPGRDILEASANNLYVDVTLDDLEGFTERYPLNSRLVNRDARLVEEVYSAEGRYGEAISRIVGHLEAAVPYATPAMETAIEALIRAYRTGDPADWRAYDVAWVADRESPVDTINGFIEVYLDPRGHMGAWEGVVFYVNREKTRAIESLASNAQWFEDRMPWDPAYRKPNVTGITARAIDVVVEAGDAGPVSAIGINLPNDQTVREEHGSKSVTLSNVLEAYESSTPPEFRREFSFTAAEADRADRYSALASELTTNMHEVIGHASGRVSDRLGGEPQAFLKEQYSALEEARADLVALYFVADPKLVELGLVADTEHAELVLAEYEGYARNAIVQLRRVREGTQIEEDHMRNRQMIVRWLLDNTPAIEVRERDGKTYYVVTDVAAFREGVGRLLGEVQRIKAEGDYEAARLLFETYGVHFDPALRDQVLRRVETLDLPAYTGFVMPRLDPVYGADGAILDVRISYPRDLTTQMLEYADRYGMPDPPAGTD